MANLDQALPPGPDWIGRKFADLERAITELRAARAIEATIGDPDDVGDLRDAVGSLPAPGQVARRDQANTYAADQSFAVVFVGTASIRAGTGDPDTVVVAEVGSLFLRTDGGAGTSLYVKESGSGTSSGWTPK